MWCQLYFAISVDQITSRQVLKPRQIRRPRSVKTERISPWWNSARSAGHGANSQGMRAPLCLTIKPPSQHPPLHQMSTPLPRPSVCFPLSLNSCSLWTLVKLKHQSIRNKKLFLLVFKCEPGLVSMFVYGENLDTIKAPVTPPVCGTFRTNLDLWSRSNTLAMIFSNKTQSTDTTNAWWLYWIKNIYIKKGLILYFDYMGCSVITNTI